MACSLLEFSWPRVSLYLSIFLSTAGHAAHAEFAPLRTHPARGARRAMGPTPESGGATQALAVIRAAAGDLALAYAWTVVCFKAWDDALER